MQLGDDVGRVRLTGEGDVRSIADTVQKDGMVRARQGRPKIARGLPRQERQAGAVRESQVRVLLLQEGQHEPGAERVVPRGTSLPPRAEEPDPRAPQQRVVERRRNVAEAGGQDGDARRRGLQKRAGAVGRGHDGLRTGHSQLLRELEG